MKYTINIDHKNKLIRYRHSGIIHSDDIEAAWADFLKLQEFTGMNYNLFSDFRGGKIDIPRLHLPVIIEFMRVIEGVVKGKKQALIVDEPYSVAASMVFAEKVSREIGFNVRVFSTEAAALRWLLF